MTGLTPFLTGMIRADDAQLARAVADPERVARHHGLRVEDVRWHLDWWRMRR